MYTSIFKGRSQRQQQQRRKRTKFNLFCEQLEGRQLLSTGTTLGSFGPIYLTYGQTLNQVVNDGITPAKVNINGNDVQGTWTFAAASDPTKDLTQAVLDAGSHTTDLTATFTPAGTTDSYNAASVDVEVAKAKIAIVADSYERTFGNPNPILTDTVYADLGPATGIDPTTGQDYSTETDPSTGKPYEVYEQLGSTDLAPVAYTSTLGSAAAASTDAGPLSHVGSYDINPTQISDAGAGTASHQFLNNFDVSYYGGTLTVDQATGTTLGSFGPIYLTYGQTLNQVVNGGITPAEVNINGNDVQGTWTFAAASDPTKDLTQAVLDAGSHTTDLTATFHPFDTADWGDNYTASSVDVEIAKAKIDIVADSYEKTYGDANPTLTDTIYADLGPATEIDPTTGKPYEVYKQLDSTDLASVTYTDALDGAAAASTAADQFSHVGSYDINPTQISDAGAGTASHEFLNNFDVTYANGTLTVTPKALTITANDATKTYGDTLTFSGTEFSTSGLVNSDTVASVTLASDGAAATAHVIGSPYAITASDAVAGTGTQLTDYIISYQAGKLTVSPAALTITANDATKTYGDTLTFSGTEFSTSGLVNSDTVASVTLASDGAAATAHVIGSPYAITASDAVAGTGTQLTDYIISYQAGKLTVSPAALTITANDATKTYGDTLTFSGTEFSTSGLVNSDTVASVTLASDGAAATAHVIGSPYAITASDAVAGTGTQLTDYIISYQAGKLTVSPAALTITANDATKTYGDTLTFSGTEFSTSGLVNSDTVASVTLASDGAAATAHVIGSPYAITASDAVAGTGTQLTDYIISYQAGKLTVSPAALTITANDATKTYGDTLTFSGTEFSTSGLVNSDTVASVTLASDGAAATAHVIGSPYAITASDAVAGTGTQLTDYIISYQAGKLTVSPRALIVTANNTTMVLGGPVPTFSAYYVGLVNGDSVSNLGGSLTFTPSDTSHAGTSTIALSGTLTDSDYTIEYNPGTLTVKVPTKPIIIGLPPSKTRS